MKLIFRLRKYSLLIVITFSIVLTLSSSAFSLTLKSGRYCNQEKGFSIKFPETWRIEEGTGPPVAPHVSAFSPYETSADQFAENVNIIVVKEPHAVSLENVTERGIAILRKNMKGFYLHERGQLVTANSNSTWFIHSFNYQGVQLKAIKYTFVKGNYVYMITCTAEASKFPAYEKQFRNIAQTFQFDNIPLSSSINSSKSSSSSNVRGVDIASKLGGIAGAFVGFYFLFRILFKKKK